MTATVPARIECKNAIAEMPTAKARNAPAKKKIHRHDFSYFVDEPPSVAHGGRGVVIAGCPACKKRINTMQQFLDHLAKDAMPALIVNGSQ